MKKPSPYHESAIPMAYGNTPEFGLSKLEWFAAMAMQGLCSFPGAMSRQQIADTAVDVAEAVLFEIKKREQARGGGE